jgi:hypothetical protein
VIPSGDSIRVVHPLFRGEGGGSIPTSPLQLFMGWMLVWTSPCRSTRNGTLAFRPSPAPRRSARPSAPSTKASSTPSAIWSPPVARKLNWTGRYELRRFAIAPDAPKNTASRMLRVMRLLIAEELPATRILMSYQDKDSHTGTIYRAAGWMPVVESRVRDEDWQSRGNRAAAQTNANKVRWLRRTPSTTTRDK